MLCSYQTARSVITWSVAFTRCHTRRLRSLNPDLSDIYIDVLQLPISKQMVGRSTIDVFLLMLNEVELFRTGDLADSVEV